MLRAIGESVQIPSFKEMMDPFEDCHYFSFNEISSFHTNKRHPSDRSAWPLPKKGFSDWVYTASLTNLINVLVIKFVPCSKSASF